VSLLEAAKIEEIDTALQEWRQGDAALDPGTFIVHLADRVVPLTPEAADGVSAEYSVFDVLSTVRGYAVVTQTCDIIKSCSSSPYAEVCPLVHIEDEIFFNDVKKARRPNYAFLPQLADQHLVVDLERTMTIEKAVLARWTRIPGCTTDEERVAFANALARKRQRFAFPDGFNTGLRKFRDRIRDREGKNNSEGQLVAALDQIRVQPTPGWEAASVLVTLWFLLKPDRIQDFDVARTCIQSWIERIRFPSTFSLTNPAFNLVEPRDMTVQDYLTSYPLDYDDVSP
jgi:hypothetical protein